MWKLVSQPALSLSTKNVSLVFVHWDVWPVSLSMCLYWGQVLDQTERDPENLRNPDKATAVLLHFLNNIPWKGRWEVAIILPIICVKDLLCKGLIFAYIKTDTLLPSGKQTAKTDQYVC